MAEQLICGAIEIHGGKYEWLCSEPTTLAHTHVFKPFAIIA